ncbi:MAG: hypothetical protein PUE12_10845 [Oscillospiraceae bacterium]|nr:hypothetical protein [Oscillospiraceae bacterium]
MKNNTNKTTDNKVSVKRKLIPAVAMLATSAAMLSTSTYAWFTMSKEVEVTGINMTATVPDNIQISLGYGQKTGALTAIGSNDGMKLVKAPENNDMSEDWSNNVAFYDYYKVPKLTPASSNTGSAIYTTNDANGVGKTVNETGLSIAGTEGALELLAADKTAVVEPASSTERADYVDFPVWLRSSSISDTNISIRATVTDGTNSNAVNVAGNGDTLYKAARVSVLTGPNTNTSAGVIIPYDGSDQGSYYVSNKALTAEGVLGTRETSNTYDVVDEVTQNTAAATGNGEVIFVVPGSNSSLSAGNNFSNGAATGSSNNYGEAVCVIVRVWLEGEDVNCWNATAGQDFQIALEFTKNETT